LSFFNEERRLKKARAIDKRRALGKTRTLAGIPVVVKDAMDMKGFRPPVAGRFSMQERGG